jgi:hypothetical protein
LIWSRANILGSNKPVNRPIESVASHTAFDNDPRLLFVYLEMGLLLAFNDSFIKSLDMVSRSFIYREPLKTRVQYIRRCLDANPNTTEFLDEFDRDSQPHREDINKSNSEIIENDCIGYLARVGFREIWIEMDPCEQVVFWMHMRSLCQCCSFLKAGGNWWGGMEEEIMQHLKDNRGKPQNELIMSLIQKYTAGGALTDKLKQTFSNAEDIKNLIVNLVDVIKGSPGMAPEIVDLLTTTQNTDMEELSKDLGELFDSNSEMGSEFSQILANMTANDGISSMISNIQQGASPQATLAQTLLSSGDLTGMLSSLSSFFPSSQAQSNPELYENPSQTPHADISKFMNSISSWLPFGNQQEPTTSLPIEPDSVAEVESPDPTGRSEEELIGVTTAG